VQVTETAIDVLSEGFAFRLLLYSGREELAVSATKPPPPLPSRPAGQQQQQQSTAALLAAAASAAAAAQLAPELPTLSRSWHAGLVSGVAGENPSFAPAARLAARWVAAHCLSGALSQEAVELLVVAAYTSPGPAPPPASRTAG
jgi:U3 small nucleolar RNA-associated protein 22